jgi:hypothetical protein
LLSPGQAISARGSAAKMRLEVKGKKKTPADGPPALSLLP